MAFIKPQSPIKDFNTGDYIYPLTTADQVVMPDGSRLNSVFKHTVKKEVTLLASDWSGAAPYIQTITVDEYVDDLQVDANIIYSGDLSADESLNKAASCLSYIKKNGKAITFYCLKSKPEIDIPVEISYESSNSIATVGMSEEIDLDDELAAQAELIAELQEALQGKMGKGVLDFSIVGGVNRPSNPEENTIWVQTDDVENVVIEHWSFGVEEPLNLVEGMIWIVTGSASEVKFDAIKDNDIHLYPIFVKQYISGAWVVLTAKSYQGGEWVDWWNGELFDNGDQYEIITGGWWQNPSIYFSNYPNTTAPTITNTIHTKPASSGAASIASTKNKINLTGFKSFHVMVTGFSEGGIFLHTDDSSGDFRETAVAQIINITSAGEYSISIDSSWPPVYVSLGAAGLTSRYVTVSKIWLER